MSLFTHVISRTKFVNPGDWRLRFTSMRRPGTACGGTHSALLVAAMRSSASSGGRVASSMGSLEQGMAQTTAACRAQARRGSPATWQPEYRQCPQSRGSHDGSRACSSIDYWRRMSMYVEVVARDSHAALMCSASFSTSLTTVLGQRFGL